MRPTHHVHLQYTIFILHYHDAIYRGSFVLNLDYLPTAYCLLPTLHKHGLNHTRYLFFMGMGRKSNNLWFGCLVVRLFSRPRFGAMARSGSGAEWVGEVEEWVWRRAGWETVGGRVVLLELRRNGG